MMHRISPKWQLVLLISCTLYGVILPAAFAFVHVGDQLPPYLMYALQQVRLFNPTKPIYVLANEKAIKERPEIYKQMHIHYVYLESLEQSVEHKEFLKATWLRKNIKDGFWVSTSERFLILYDWMKKFNKHDIIHLENDILLYADVDEFMPIFKKHYPGLAVIMDEDERCIPCFMYIANQHSLHKLAAFFVEDIKTKPIGAFWDLNDMVVLAHFFNTYSKMEVNNLPIIIPSYIKTYSLCNQLGKYPKKPRMYCNNVHLFHSIFDGAALGQYVGGTNQGHPPGFINETTVFDPSKLQFIWKNDSQGRRVPFLRCKGACFRINNLHIHSKQLGQFTSIPAPINFENTILNSNQTQVH